MVPSDERPQTVDRRFYFTGGTVPRDAPSYVVRHADEELFTALQQGEFCYVLTSRQMGKSSLMARTAARLKEQGCAVVVLDLTAVGRNLTVEQWYDGLLNLVGRQLGLEDALDDFWLSHERLGPLQRWMAALREVVLPTIGARCSVVRTNVSEASMHARLDAAGGTPTVLGPSPTEAEHRAPGTEHRPSEHRAPSTEHRLVIFIDEIDAVRGLPFSTDEFFAGIRECYNRRTGDPAFERLTFCLLGVATPSDLIRDTRTTPFNIGTRIELNDFSATEAAPLARGLVQGGGPGTQSPDVINKDTQDAQDEGKEGQRLLERILYWTGGHPYLTQRLCQALAADVSAENPKSKTQNPKSIDRLCEELFLSKRARENDDNLIFVRERLLRSEADLAALLDLYGQVRRGRRVPADDTNPLVDLLHLSGITRVADARRSTLDARRWARYPRPSVAVLRALSVERRASLVVRNRIYERVFDRDWVTQHMPDAELRRQRAAYRRGLLRAAAVSAVILTVMAGLGLMAEQQRRMALEGQKTLRRSLYVSDMNVAQQAWEGGLVRRAVELLEAHRPRPGEEDLRGFEWRYLWRICHSDAPITLQGHSEAIRAVAFSPDGRALASASQDGAVKLWDMASRHEIAAFQGHIGLVRSMAFSPNGRILASAGTGRYGTIRLWDIAVRREVATLMEDANGVSSMTFSPDGRTLATSHRDGTVKLWDAGRANDAGAGAGTRRAVATIPGPGVPALWVAFSPDRKKLVTGCQDEKVRFWDLATKRQIATLHLPWGGVSSGALSPDGKLLATVDAMNPAVMLWDIASATSGASEHAQRVATLRGHRDRVVGLAFSPDGKLLASASTDNTVRLWNVIAQRAMASFTGHRDAVTALVFSPDGKTLATGSLDCLVKLWSVTDNQGADTLQGRTDRTSCVVFSPDSKTLATTGYDRTVQLWDVATGREAASLPSLAQAVSAVAFSPDGRSVATATSRPRQANSSGEVILWDVTTKQKMATLRGHQGPVLSVAFSANGTTVASGGSDGTARLWDVTSGQVLATLRYPYLGGGANPDVRDVAFSPDGKILATTWVDGSVWLWDVATRQALPSLRGHQGPVTSVVFSPDGRMLASGSWDRTVRVWDVASRRALVTLEGSQGAKGFVAFSPDSKTLAVGNTDGSVTLWNINTWHEVAAFRNAGPTIAFSPDGQTLATKSVDNMVKLWRAATFAETDAPSGPPPSRRR
jgi:WD40 repeat protein